VLLNKPVDRTLLQFTPQNVPVGENHDFNRLYIAELGPKS